MRISSVKPVLWWLINLHLLLSNGVAFNTQSRSSQTSYAISRSILQAIHRWGDVLIITEPALLTRCAWHSHARYRAALMCTVIVLIIVFISCSLHSIIFTNIVPYMYWVHMYTWYVLHIYSIFVIHTVMLLSLHKNFHTCTLAFMVLCQ